MMSFFNFRNRLSCD